MQVSSGLPEALRVLNLTIQHEPIHHHTPAPPDFQIPNATALSSRDGSGTVLLLELGVQQESPAATQIITASLQSGPLAPGLLTPTPGLLPQCPYLLARCDFCMSAGWGPLGMRLLSESFSVLFTDVTLVARAVHGSQ